MVLGLGLIIVIYSLGLSYCTDSNDERPETLQGRLQVWLLPRVHFFDGLYNSQTAFRGKDSVCVFLFGTNS